MIGRPGRGVAKAREQVAMAFDDLRFSDLWVVHPSGASYRWRPWRSWVIVRDPGLEWRDLKTGLNFFDTPVR
jgi:hypothetical protein